MTTSFARFITGSLLLASTVGIAAGTGLAVLDAAPAGAATTITVNDANDTGSGTDCTPGSEGDCTLRAALAEATTISGDVTINLPDPSSVANNPGPVYQVLTSELVVTPTDASSSITVAGVGASTSVIQATCTGASCTVDFRVFHVTGPGTTTISGVTIEGGSISGANGGGIWNDGGDLTLDNDTLANNSSDTDGGALSNQGTLSAQDSTFLSNGASGSGGAIDQEGDSSAVMTLTNGTISANTAGFDGGGLFVESGTLTLTGGTIGGIGSTAPADQGNSAANCGGGLALASGQGTVSGVTFGGTNSTQGNTATNCGGGIFMGLIDPSFSGDTISHNSTGGNGGGVAMFGGNATFTNETISSNQASSYGGGLSLDGLASATLTTSTVRDNTVTAGYDNLGFDREAGAGIAVNNPSDTGTANLTVDHSTVTANSGTDGDGGGIVAFNSSDASLDPNLTVDVTDSTISDNTIGSESYDIYGGGLSIEDGTWKVTGTSIAGNGSSSSYGYGGGVDTYDYDQSVTFSNDTITANYAYDGGGLENDDGNVTITDSTVKGNTASETAAGILVDNNDDNTTTVTSSTINGNESVASIGRTPYTGDGGGFTSIGCNPVTLTNDTITDNRAFNEGGGYYGVGCGLQFAAIPHAHPQSHQAHTGGRVQAQPAGTTTLLFDTITDNITGDAAGGGNIQQDDASTITMAETIVAGGVVGTSPTTNCKINTGAGAIFTSKGYNLVDDTTCGTPAATDIIGKNPQLGSLADNGGPTKTQLPPSDSPEAGVVPESVWLASGVSEDQRGVARGAGPGSSATIGSVEVGVNYNGYRLVADEGGIFDFGLLFSGSLANNHLNAPIVGLANAPGPAGYLMVGADGGVFALGGAAFYGSLGGTTLPSPIAAIAAPPTETGYWLVAQDGTTYHFGSVPSLPNLSLPSGAHIVGMASTTDGKGAWMVDQFGDVYAEGTAQYVGGLGGTHINEPIVGIAAAATGQGYVLVASDGGVFAYGSQGFYGSVPGSLAPGQSLVAPIVGIAVTHSGHGYWEVGADGGVFTYGDAPFLGSIYTAIDGTPLNGPIVGIQHLGNVSS